MQYRPYYEVIVSSSGRIKIEACITYPIKTKNDTNMCRETAYNDRNGHAVGNM
jgi:hypothetical protein